MSCRVRGDHRAFYVGEDRETASSRSTTRSSRTSTGSAQRGELGREARRDRRRPIVVATLWSDRPRRSTTTRFRRIAEEVEIELQGGAGTNRTEVVGGRPRAARIELCGGARRAPDLRLEVAGRSASRTCGPGPALRPRGREIQVEADGFVGDVGELGDLVVNVIDGVPVFLEDVARIEDGPDEPPAPPGSASGRRAAGAAPGPLPGGARRGGEAEARTRSTWRVASRSASPSSS